MQVETQPPIEEDLWGRILKDYYAGKGKPVAIRRDDGFAEEGSWPASYFSPPPAEEQTLLQHLRGRVLDVGCGPGRHLLWLQEQGREAVGLDHSGGAVAIAQARGCRRLTLMKAVALGFPDQSFDNVLLMGNNLGLAGTLESTVQFFGELHRIVTPGGFLLGVARDPLITDRPLDRAYQQEKRNQGRPRGEVLLRFEYDGRVGEWFPWLRLERDRLPSLLGTAGWKILEMSPHRDDGLYSVIARCA